MPFLLLAGVAVIAIGTFLKVAPTRFPDKRQRQRPPQKPDE
jgi:hypothetical protein